MTARGLRAATRFVPIKIEALHGIIASNHYTKPPLRGFGLAFLLVTLSLTHAKMPSPVFPYDREWANSLVGLPMSVPEHWWPGYTSSTLCLGKIIPVGTHANTLNCFILQVHNEPGQRYGMRYDAVYLYADENHRNISKYHLPSDPPGDPTQE